MEDQTLKIQDLLETVLVRHQKEWVGNKEPVITVPQREGGRHSHASSANAYAMHYGLKLNGHDSPRRWNSSFASTSPEESMFITGVGGSAGLRTINLPSDRLCGYVADDFNSDEFNLGIWKELSQIHGWLDSTSNSSDLPHDIARNMLRATSNLDTILHSNLGTDEGYEKFLSLIELIDALLTKYNKPTATSLMKERMGEVLASKQLGVATFSTLPQGNWEVWFEGPYEAHAINDGDNK